ncbi:MAG: hypothetical protein EA374_01255 [Acholeplasmatales bacterium]|nr:MAG: hypothetical protein EA374_01255 [Acholeplasmatales bacterium]
MQEKPRITFKNIVTTLNNVQYQKSKRAKGVFQVSVKETVEVLEATYNRFALSFSRHITVSPESLFELVVTYHVEGEVDEQALTTLNQQNTTLRQFIETSKKTIVQTQNVVGHSSLLIAQITAYNERNPLVLQPFLHKGEPKKTSFTQ